jgi:ribosomal protein S12
MAKARNFSPMGAHSIAQDMSRKGSSRKKPRRGIVVTFRSLETQSRLDKTRRIAKVKFPDGSEATAYIPSGVKGVTEGSPVLIRASRTNSLTEVDQRVVKPLNGRYKLVESRSGEPGFTWNWTSKTT